MNPSPIAPQADRESDGSSAYLIWDNAKDARERHQAPIDSDSTAIYFCNAAGIIVYYNGLAAELWGRTPAIGDSDEPFCRPFMRYRANGRPWPDGQLPMADVPVGKVPGIYDAEAHIQRSNGSRVVVIVNIVPLIDVDDVIVGAINSFRENPLRKSLK